MSIFKKASVRPIVKTVISQGLDDYNNPDPSMEDAETYDAINRSFEGHDDKAYYDFKKLSPQKQFIDELLRLENFWMNTANGDYEAGITEGLGKALALVDKYLRN
jgi:hypothetical protein